MHRRGTCAAHEHHRRIPKTILPRSAFVFESRVTPPPEEDAALWRFERGPNTFRKRVFPNPVPAGRQDVVELERWLDQSLREASSAGDTALILGAAQRAYSAAFHEIARQVYVHTEERGRLLLRVWRGYIALFEELNSALRQASVVDPAAAAAASAAAGSRTAPALRRVLRDREDEISALKRRCAQLNEQAAHAKQLNAHNARALLGLKERIFDRAGGGRPGGGAPSGGVSGNDPAAVASQIAELLEAVDATERVGALRRERSVARLEMHEARAGAEQRETALREELESLQIELGAVRARLRVCDDQLRDKRGQEREVRECERRRPRGGSQRARRRRLRRRPPFLRPATPAGSRRWAPARPTRPPRQIWAASTALAREKLPARRTAQRASGSGRPASVRRPPLGGRASGRCAPPRGPDPEGGGSALPDGFRPLFAKPRTIATKGGQPLRRVLATVLDVLDAKVEADLVDDKSNNRRQTLPEFLYDWFLNQYGLRKLSETKLVELLGSLLVHRASHPSVDTFGRLCGLVDPLGGESLNFYLDVLAATRSQIVAGGKKKPQQLGATPRPAAPVGGASGGAPPASFPDLIPKLHMPGAKAIASKFLGRALTGFEEKAEELIRHVLPRVEALARLDPDTGSLPVIDREEFMKLMVDEWALLAEQRNHHLAHLFVLGDVDGDGILTFDEFSAIIAKVDPSMHRRQVMHMFRAAHAPGEGSNDDQQGDDDADDRIRQEDFVRAATEHGLLSYRPLFFADTGECPPAAATSTSPPPSFAQSRSTAAIGGRKLEVGAAQQAAFDYTRT